MQPSIHLPATRRGGSHRRDVVPGLAARVDAAQAQHGLLGVCVRERASIVPELYM